MNVRDIMTSAVIACTTDVDVGVAARRMLEGNFGALPVIDRLGKIAGIITDRDICLACATRQRNAAHISVREAMSAHARTCGADDDVTTALETMKKARVRRLPVVDAAGVLRGILSIDDILLRAAGQPDGPLGEAIIAALKQICAPRELEAELSAV